jgi:hypothetical protein
VILFAATRRPAAFLADRLAERFPDVAVSIDQRAA